MVNSEFEAKLVESVLAGNDEILSILRAQYQVATLREREETGVGIALHFEVPDSAPELRDARDFEVDDLFIEVEGVEGGISPVLFVRQGRIAFLEAVVASNQPWPEDLSTAEFWYSSPTSPGSTEWQLSGMRNLATQRLRWLGKA